MIAPLLLAVDFMNFTYATNPCSKNVPVPVVMRKSNFSYFDDKMGAGFDLNVHSVTEGGLAKGTRQAVVVLACDFPADGGTAEAYAFDERKNGAVLLSEVAAANWAATGEQDPIRFTSGLRNSSYTSTSAKTTTARWMSSRRMPYAAGSW